MSDKLYGQPVRGNTLEDLKDIATLIRPGDAIMIPGDTRRAGAYMAAGACLADLVGEIEHLSGLLALSNERVRELIEINGALRVRAANLESDLADAWPARELGGVQP